MALSGQAGQPLSFDRVEDAYGLKSSKSVHVSARLAGRRV
jgi:hypothetical protein